MNKNSNEVDSKADGLLPTFKEKCVSCIKGPNLAKTIVVAICFGVLVQQLSACVRKLAHKPITTYTHFDFNKTIAYPSVTLCREPPYKFDKMMEYGLYAHPRFTSMWVNYNFSIPLDQLWEDITYNPDEIFQQYGLDGSMDNVEVKTYIGFIHGRCYTLSPKVLSTRTARRTGYSITLVHNADDIANTIGVDPPGYHVYIHYTRESFTEIPVHNGGLVNYFHFKVGETIDVSLTVNQYVMISSSDDPCVDNDSYSANNCTTRRVWSEVERIAGCSGPWLLGSDLPACHNFTTMRRLISTYMSFIESHNFSVCPRFCRSYLYNGFINDRHSFAWDGQTKLWTAKIGNDALQTQFYIYFNTMMVSVFEERYNYDWNTFMSDLGGSVGFLLGLSVISIMSILGKFWAIFVKPKVKSSIDSNAEVKIKSSIDSNAEIKMKSPVDANAEIKIRSPIDSNAEIKMKSPIDSNAEIKIKSPIDSNAEVPTEKKSYQENSITCVEKDVLNLSY
ncbi:hypothetical protein evm_014133 [Chilo suppressalis]|nr:hypothetical protein evm_014133 [Chilo suppressalis]